MHTVHEVVAAERATRIPGLQTIECTGAGRVLETQTLRYKWARFVILYGDIDSGGRAYPLEIPNAQLGVALANEKDKKSPSVVQAGKLPHMVI